ncbi:hypothetical protein TNIN_283831 [Trichonephila inaurata madagascariensis]|uniref:Uncharacterized protein n=1 Tax=Trichonephila inaurata madagascariensis TaxID=2747483 RepID=A0A8X7CQJ0_9ARAC|nr:hypothetical protein TNIN_283831 [Trichonephila inaurata madagascariensis]
MSSFCSTMQDRMSPSSRDLAVCKLPSATFNNSDADDEDYVENFAQEENISSSDDEEIDKIQRPSSSHIPVKTENGVYRR